MNSLRILINLIACSWLAGSCLKAQTVDSFFNPNANGFVLTIALQADGKVLIGGDFTSVGGQTRRRIARLHSDGTLDLRFDPDISGNRVLSLAVQSDGKILVGGDMWAVGGQSSGRLSRLNTDGSLDTDFNAGGNSEVNSIALQPDGKILVGGGFNSIGGQARNRIARLNANGSADPSFNPDVGVGLETLALQADGKVVVGGYFTSIGGQARSYLARLNSNGTLDTTFNPNANARVFTLAVQADGKLIVDGDFTSIGGQTRNQLVRLTTSGSLDTTFNANASGNSVYSIGMQSNGKLVLGGDFAIAGQRYMFAWLNADGSLSSGVSHSGVGYSARAIAVHPDGKVIVGGGFTSFGGQARNGIARMTNLPAVSSLTVTGTSQISWARSGAAPEVEQVTFDTWNGSSWISQGTAARVSGGWRRTGLALANSTWVRARGISTGGTANGSSGIIEQIATYGGGNFPEIAVSTAGSDVVSGTSAVDFGSLVWAGSTTWSPVTGTKTITIKNDGTAVLSGMTASLTGTNSEGVSLGSFGATSLAPGSSTTLQITFQPMGMTPLKCTLNLSSNDGDESPFLITLLGSGIQTDTGFNPSSNDEVVALAAQPDGKMLVGGLFTSIGGGFRKYLARLNENGTLDAGFTPPVLYDRISALAIQQDGKMLIGGSSGAVARLNDNGSLDTGFNQSVGSRMNSLVLQPDGKVLVGGVFTSVGGQTRNRIARLNMNGSLDSGFNPNADSEVYCIAVQSDGKILVGGYFTTMGGQPRNRIARLNMDGSVDSGFNPGASAYVQSIVVQPDGKILVGGAFSNIGGGSQRSIARLNPDGSLETAFNPSPNFNVNSVALQADGKILLGGDFSHVGGQTRNKIARLNADGTLDTTFNPNANGNVRSVALQVDGKVFVAGQFTNVGGQPRSGFARLLNNPAASTLNVTANQIDWLRSGTAPEVEQVTFDRWNGSAWVSPVAAVHVSGGWRATGLALPAGQVRARGRTSGGQYNASSGIVEQITTYAGIPNVALVDELGNPLISEQGTLDFGNLQVNETTSKTVTIRNTGTASLTGIVVTSSHSSFTVTTGTRTSLSPGGQTNCVIVFKPTAAGAANGTLLVRSNDPDENSITLALTGTGIANTPPTFAGLEIFTGYQTPAAITSLQILSAASDIDGQALSIISVGPASAQGGTALLQDGTVTYTPANGFGGTDSFPVTIRDSAGATVTGTVTVTVTQTAPTISPIATQVTDRGIMKYGIAFTVADGETPPESLTLSATSNNPTLVPNANILFDGTGANRTVRVVPVSTQVGSTTITIQVSDGMLISTTTFVLNVNERLTLSKSPNYTIGVGKGWTTLGFTVGGSESALSELIMSGTSSDASLVLDAEIVFSGSGTHRSLTIPHPNRSGYCVITLTATYGAATVSEEVNIMFEQPTLPPTISSIVDRNIVEGEVIPAIALSVGSPQGSVDALTLTGSSSNEAVVSNSKMVFGGSGQNRTLTITPEPYQRGTTTITVTVSDGFLNESTSFDLTVLAGTPAFTQPATVTIVAGSAFEFQLQATNGPNTFTCSNLPPWLSLNAATGWLSGTPPAAGDFNLSLTANNGFNTGSSSLAITVTSPPPTITSSLSDEGRQNVDYRYTITAVGTPTSFSTGVLPSGLNFNPTTGVISGIPTVSGTFNVVLGATNAGGTTNATLVLRVLPPIPPPVITSPSFASGTANAPFSFQLAASNTPQSYGIQSGLAWLSVNPATGLLSGTPTVPGTATVQVRASNATGAGAWAMLSISFSPNPSAPVITSLVEARGRRNAPFSFQVTCSPAATSYVLAGTLPTGIVFGGSSGLFSGTPTVEGTFNLTLTASNSSGQSVPTPIRIVLGPSRQVPVVTSATSFVATNGVAFSASILASNSPSSFTFTGLPPGLAQVGTTAQISGTPTTPGSFNFTVRATNADGSGPIQNGMVTVRYHANAPRITASTVPTGYVGVPFSHQLLTDKPATLFAVVGGSSLPAGLTLGASSGLIGGTPTASGSFSATLQASNASGAGEPRSIVITIAPKPDTPEIIGSLLEETYALASYSYSVQTKSLLPILSYSITGLPDGLTANPTTGRISGVATVAGVFEVKLKASNSVGVGAEKVMRLKVRAGSLVPKITSSASVSVVQGTPFSYQITTTNAPILGWEAAPLPDGLSLNPSTGIISGKPVIAGTYQVTLRASNVNGASDPLTLQIQVKPQVTVPVMVSQSYFSIVKSQPINVELQATNLPVTRPWSSGMGIFAEDLPEGMSLNAATGVLSGEPSSTAGFTSDSYYSYSYSSFFSRRSYFHYSPWYSKTVKFYATNEAGRGPTRWATVKFKPSDTTIPPVIYGPKQLSWTVNQPLNFKITANLAASSHEFQIQNGSKFSQAESVFSISGSHTPLPGRNTYRLGVSNGSWGYLDGLPLSVTPAAGAPRITNSNSMTATAGVPVSATLAASGSPTRYEITAMSPAWPAGLSFNATTGAFSGTVSQSGAISFLARAYNAVGACLPKEITLFVSPPPGAPVITTGTGIASRSALGIQSMKTMAAPPAPLVGKVGEAFSHQFEATGNIIRYMVTGLPEGLVYNENTGEVTGEPTQPGLYDLVVTPIGTSVSGQPAMVSLRIDAADGTPEMTNPSSASAVAGTAFSWQFSATENPAGYDLAELPDWLVFNALTGSLSGTPEVPGETTLKISAFNASGQGNAQQFTIETAAAAGTPVVNPPSGNFTGQVGLAFNAAISGAGAGSFYDASALPFGISLDSETGIFSGMPVEPGSHEVQVWGVNAQGTGEQVIVTFVISPAAGTPLFVGEAVLRLVEGQPLAHTFSTVPNATAFAVEGLPTGWSYDPVSGLLQGTPLSGTYPLTLEAWNEVGGSGKQAFQVRVFPNPGDLWSDEKFGEQASDPAISGWDADPDGDGVVNLLERAFNLSPVQAGPTTLRADIGTAGLPLIRATQGPSGPGLAIQYLRRKASTQSGLTYTPQFSSSLDGSGGWSDAMGTETVESIDAEWERVTLEENAGGHPKRFGRVRVTGSP